MAAINGTAEAVGTKAGVTQSITIKPPAFRTIVFHLRGTAPYCQARFSEKAIRMMRDKMEAGTTSRSKTAKPARDFEADMQGALHISEDGWYGIPAAAFRNACIDACRMAGYAMTRAKMSIFAIADGLDQVDGQPLVRLLAEQPEASEIMVRNATGVADIRVRPLWRAWEVYLHMRFDADQFTEQDVANLLMRAGMQVGVGEGRPFSKESNGMGFGTFEIVGE